MNSQPKDRDRTRWLSSLGLLLLPAAWAAAWVRPEFFPDSGPKSLPPVEIEAILFSVFSIVAASISAARNVEFPRGRDAWTCVGVGFGMFVVPAALTAYAQNSVSNLDRVALFFLTPMFAVVLEPYLQGVPPNRGKASLVGVLCAIAGGLFLFPLDIPGSFRSGVALCALVVAAFSVASANCIAVRLSSKVAKRSTLPMASLAGGASAACFAAATAFAPHIAFRWSATENQLLGSITIDLPALFLLFWLMRSAGASRMTARFLLGPLFAILAETILERAMPPPRGWLGIVLVAGGAGWLIFAPAESIDADERPLIIRS